MTTKLIDASITVRGIVRANLNRTISDTDLMKAMQRALKSLVDNNSYDLMELVQEEIDGIETNTPVQRAQVLPLAPLEEGEERLTSAVSNDRNDDFTSNVEEIEDYEIRVRI